MAKYEPPTNLRPRGHGAAGYPLHQAPAPRAPRAPTAPKLRWSASGPPRRAANDRHEEDGAPTRRNPTTRTTTRRPLTDLARTLTFAEAEVSSEDETRAFYDARAAGKWTPSAEEEVTQMLAPV
ncbi:MAG TPA: hypothetical protein VM580_22380, partial [Labilithrix sp.]|nr:hypothetical protein [Labilithrix sp.]